MSFEKVLYAAQAATSATKVEFDLTPTDFQGNVIPQLRSTGGEAGDDVFLWHKVNGVWQNLGSILDEANWVYNLTGVGHFALTITLAAVGPISVSLFSANSA